MKKVSIITINYNGYKDTCELIDSLEQIENQIDYELIVVDNFANDEEGLRLKEKENLKLKVICSNENLGFAGGNNLGLRKAEGEYIIFINNDIVIKEPFIQKLIDTYENNNEIGLISPKIKY